MIKLTFSLVALLALSCSVYAEAPSAFKVGAVLPLTGPLAEYGVAAKHGIEMARREHPDLFTHIDFIIDDSQYDGKQALSSFQKLKNAEHVSVIYLWGYGPSQAVAPVAEQEKFPIIAVAGDRSISLNRNYTVRFGYHMQMLADALLPYLRAHKIEKIGIIKTELAYMDGLIDSMRPLLRAPETLEVVETFQLGDSDFKTTIAKLRAKRFDSLGVFLSSGQISLFYRQSHQMGYKPPTFGTDFFDSMKEVRDAEGAMVGAVFAAPFADASFIARYVKNYGDDLQVAWAANSYEFAMLTASLFGEVPGPLTGDQILARYKTARTERGEAARYAFNESPLGSGFDFKVVLRKVESDRIVDLTE